MAKSIAMGDSKTAVAYLRVSTGKQELGVLAQRAAIEEWARASGTTIVSWCIDEGVSGAAQMEERPGLLEAFARIHEHKAGLLLIARRDRLSRDVTHAGLIEKVLRSSGAQSHSVDGAGNGDSPTDEFTRQILNAVGQLERRIIAARTKAALAAKKARGERLGRTPLSELVPSETLELIKNLYASGNFSHERLADELNLRGIPTATGRGKWRKNTVQKALQTHDSA